MFKEILNMEMFKENEHSENAYASELDYCLRKIWYKRMGYESYHNLPTEINFKQGNAIHTLFQDLFVDKAEALGYKRAYKEVRMNNEVIHGFMDMVFISDTEIHIMEIKSAKTLPKKPYSHHITQINTYMNPYIENQAKHKKKVRGTIYYVEKAVLGGNSPQVEFEISYDHSKFLSSMERSKQMKQALNDNILPVAEAKVNKNYWECKLCYFWNICRKAGREAKQM